MSGLLGFKVCLEALGVYLNLVVDLLVDPES